VTPARPRRPQRLRTRFSGCVVAGLALLGGVAPARGDEALQRRLGREDPRAVALELALGAGPYDALVWVHLAQVAVFTCDLPAAHHRVDAALALDPLSPAAHAARSAVLLHEARGAEALAAADRGLALPGARGSVELWRARALALVELRRYAEALEAAGRAVGLAPDDARAAEALGRAAYHAGDMPLASRAYTWAVELDPRSEEANLRLGNGFGAATAGRCWETAPDLPEFRRGLAELEAGAPEQAVTTFLALLERAPDAFKYRLGLGSALAQRRRLHEGFGEDGVSAAQAYALLPVPRAEAPDALEWIQGVVPDAASLSSVRRHALLVAATPLRPWWPRLAASGAKHDLLTMSENLSDCEERSDLRERLTFDGRRYEHLRGAGGKHGATGVEKLDEARELCFNTFAHELAHQVLTYALPAESVGRVKALYARAWMEERFLDHYAASNVDEYFAQGYEAFLSHAKRGCLKETQRHTRLELRTRDPALYDFFVEHLDLGHETPEAMAPFLAALARLGAPARGADALRAPPPTPR
jgi:tetratricopeptide (TPR) repeat protein